MWEVVQITEEPLYIMTTTHKVEGLDFSRSLNLSMSISKIKNLDRT